MEQPGLFAYFAVGALIVFSWPIWLALLIAEGIEWLHFYWRSR